MDDQVGVAADGRCEMGIVGLREAVVTVGGSTILCLLQATKDVDLNTLVPIPRNQGIQFPTTHLRNPTQANVPATARSMTSTAASGEREHRYR